MQNQVKNQQEEEGDDEDKEPAEDAAADTTALQQWRPLNIAEEERTADGDDAEKKGELGRGDTAAE